MITFHTSESLSDLPKKRCLSPLRCFRSNISCGQVIRGWFFVFLPGLAVWIFPWNDLNRGWEKKCGGRGGGHGGKRGLASDQVTKCQDLSGNSFHTRIYHPSFFCKKSSEETRTALHCVWVSTCPKSLTLYSLQYTVHTIHKNHFGVISSEWTFSFWTMFHHRKWICHLTKTFWIFGFRPKKHLPSALWTEKWIRNP